MKALLVGFLFVLLSSSFAKDDENRGGTASSAQPELVTLPSGLQYRVVKPAEGKKPLATSKVKVHYVGKLTNGTVIDSSRKRGQPSTFPVTGVIRGLQEGFQLMPNGATYEFIIPSKLGYGNADRGNIPANSTTIWEVELLSFVE